MANSVSVSGRVGSVCTRNRREKTLKTPRITKLVRFFLDFAPEIDIFDTDLRVPSWVFAYREKQIRKISPELRRICYDLKSRGLTFKIKWPVEIDGHWRFADVIFPRQRTVLMVANPMSLVGLPHWMLSDRAEFFSKHFRVVEVETLEDLQRKIEMKAQCC